MTPSKRHPHLFPALFAGVLLAGSFLPGFFLAGMVFPCAAAAQNDSLTPEPAERPSMNVRRHHDVRFLGADPWDELGVQACFADLNGDGFDEVILGAWLADGPRNERSRAGEVYIFFGRALEDWERGTLDPSVIYGGRAGDRIGSSLDSGDFNGDGIPDLLIGARYANGPSDSLRARCGEAFLVLGGSAGERHEVVDLREKPDIHIIGLDEGDRFGRRIHVQDLDRDGREDLLMAAIGSDGRYDEDADAGAVYVLYGRPRDDFEKVIDLGDRELPVLHGSDESDGLGGAMATGDWDGDGQIDIVLGCGFADGPANGRTNAGEAYVLFGTGKRFEGETVLTEGGVFTIYGADSYDGAGIAVACADFDGDGVDDIALGANLADGPKNHRDKCGEAYVLLGSPSVKSDRIFDLTYAPDLTIYGAREGDQFGAILNLQDWNDDGFSDLLVASLLSDGPGAQREDAGMLYVILGAAQTDLEPRVDLATGSGDLFLLGPSAQDKIATAFTMGRMANEDVLFAATMLGDGPHDEKNDTGEVYVLRWRALTGQ